MSKDYNLKVVSPEIGNKDKGPSITACDVGVDLFTKLLQQGLHRPKSLADAETKMVRELLGYEIVAYTEEELDAQRQAPGMAQEPIIPEIEEEKEEELK